jgi:hypothetical protein
MLEKVARLMTRLGSTPLPPAVAALQQHPAALPPKLSAALKGVDTQLDALINDAVPMRKASYKLVGFVKNMSDQTTKAQRYGAHSDRVTNLG